MICLFVFPDSMEDLTDPEAIRLNPKCDRTVSLYGYLRGTFLKNKCQVHIPGEISMFAIFFTDIQMVFKKQTKKKTSFASRIRLYNIHVAT